jgi:Pyridine nucleotide-disulphide oxidoreductase
VAAEGGAYDLPYDYLVVALGASTNDGLIPGSSNALTFKTMADALVLRNHLIERFERADATADAAQRCECLTVVVIGGGLVGVELAGELTAFADDVLRFYPRIRRDEVCFRLFEAGPRILPEVDAKLAAAAARVLEHRGIDIHVSTAVRSASTVPFSRSTLPASTGRHRGGRSLRPRVRPPKWRLKSGTLCESSGAEGLSERPSSCRRFDAHGGIDRWRQFESVSAHLRNGGIL